MARLGLPGKPDPALFLEAARRLAVPVPRTAVVEDALAGVEATAAAGSAWSSEWTGRKGRERETRCSSTGPTWSYATWASC